MSRAKKEVMKKGMGKGMKAPKSPSKPGMPKNNKG